MVEKSGVGLRVGCQPHDLVARDAIPDHEAAGLGLHGPLQFVDAGVDELDAAVGRVGQRIQDFPIEEKRADHLPGMPERVVERGMVKVAQTPAKPDQGVGCIPAWGERVTIV